MLDDEAHILIRRAFNRTNRALTRLAGELGLHPGQPKVLEYLSEHDGCTASEMCRGCIIDKSTMATLLPRMEAQGLVRRETDGSDGRSSLVFLTDEGRGLAERFRMEARRVDERAFQNVSDADRAATLRTLRRIAGLDDADLYDTPLAQPQGRAAEQPASHAHRPDGATPAGKATLSEEVAR